jgi:DNA polymerase III alpha subunit
MKLPDIDIDLKNRDELLSILEHIPASLDGSKKHNTGVYFTNVPVNPLTNVSSIDYKEAERRGYFKLDLLNVGVYENIKNEEHLSELISREPVWELFEHKDIVEKLFHIHNHYEVVKQLKPKSIKQLAAVLAVIRPAKRYLLKKGWDKINEEVWIKPKDDSYYFKKSHSIAYAIAIVVQLNLLVDDID